MVKKKISKYTFSLLLLLLAMGVTAQNEDRRGLSLGLDLSRFATPLVDTTRFGWELSADYELLDDLFGVVELGSQSTRFQPENYTYRSDGIYTRLGVDYNYMKHVDSESTDKLFIGLRYAFTTYFHEAGNIIIYDPVWGDFTQDAVERKFLSANWMEVATGMRARLFNNFYLGWSARFRVKIWFQGDQVMQPYHIPGYGRGWAASRMGFNYSLYYRIPLMKKHSISSEALPVTNE